MRTEAEEESESVIGSWRRAHLRRQLLGLAREWIRHSNTFRFLANVGILASDCAVVGAGTVCTLFPAPANLNFSCRVTLASLKIMHKSRFTPNGIAVYIGLLLSVCRRKLLFTLYIAGNDPHVYLLPRARSVDWSVFEGRW